VVLGTVVTNWYDRRGLYRIQPELLAYVSKATQDYLEQRGDGSPPEQSGTEAPAPASPPPSPSERPATSPLRPDPSAG
ncbi:MAG TPA: hypothetical protein VGF64_17150, partial [Acidimicrobiales bacterium]